MSINVLKKIPEQYAKISSTKLLGLGGLSLAFIERNRIGNTVMELANSPQAQAILTNWESFYTPEQRLALGIWVGALVSLTTIAGLGLYFFGGEKK